MDRKVRAYLSEIGRRGGRKSRRILDPEMARAMVRVREARRAYRRFHTRCFWSFRPEYKIGLADVPWVTEQLRKHGGGDAWEVSRRGCAADRLSSEPRPVHPRVFVLGALCWAACGKDPGFTPLSLLDLLRRRGRVGKEDLARLDLAVPIDLKALKQEWLEALDSVESFVGSRPAEEIGCLYYSASRRGCVDPREAGDSVPHFGRPGGVLPRISDR